MIYDILYIYIAGVTCQTENETYYTMILILQIMKGWTFWFINLQSLCSLRRNFVNGTCKKKKWVIDQNSSWSC